MVLAILGLILGFIPDLNSYGVWLAVIALAFGVFGFLRKFGRAAKILLAVGALGLVVSLASVAIQNNQAWNAVDDTFARKDGSRTEQLLKTDSEVKFGDYSDDGLTVTIKNKYHDTKSYSVLIEAKSSDGTVIDKQLININEISTDSEKDVVVFKDVDADTREQLKSADFAVTWVSQY
jgi:hypothetical protein